MNCRFCQRDVATHIYHGQLVAAVWAENAEDMHAVLFPRRHVSSWTALEGDELTAMMRAIQEIGLIMARICDPSHLRVQFDVALSVQDGTTHCHMRILPVREIPAAHPDDIDETSVLSLPPLPVPDATLISGASSRDTMLYHLTHDLVRAERWDVAVAFILKSGIELMAGHIEDFLERGGELRLLTGDYLNITDPDALYRLLDFQGKKDVRIFETKGTSFHPKAYIFYSRETSAHAYIGSSNLTKMALLEGMEWNYRLVLSEHSDAFSQIQRAFDILFNHPQSRPLDASWVRKYATRPRQSHAVTVDIPREEEYTRIVPEPHVIQREALTKLVETRQHGSRAGLVVLATGLGKTWLSAFDSNRPEFRRILFIAHREEILKQSRDTYRKIRPDAVLGMYTGQDKDVGADVLFASIQTLGRSQHRTVFEPDAFDYIVMDEFHHAAAATYRRVLNYFRPRFLLGMTATPERTDGGDLLGLCGGNLVYRCDMVEGIHRNLLCPFHYYGVPDEVDYQNIPWRSNRFDEDALTLALATQKRAENALDQLQKRGGKKVLAFCCSTKHADFMAEFLNQHEVPAVAVHSGPTSSHRTMSLERLKNGEIRVLCSVDLFNEGVDLPDVDTIMMLRPTESKILWLQQFGRGLRPADEKEHLRVIDYIGNHRVFLLKPQVLFGIAGNDAAVHQLLRDYAAGLIELPPGCMVEYDLEAIDIMQALLRHPRQDDYFRFLYESFREQHDGLRPTLLEAWNAGFDIARIRARYGSWFEFVRDMADLTREQTALVSQYQDFFRELETTNMTKSFKMLVILAMINRDCLPGSIDIDSLAREFNRLLHQYSLIDEVKDSDRTHESLKRMLERNPINAWTGGSSKDRTSFFKYESTQFTMRLDVEQQSRPLFQALVFELVEWRIAHYRERQRTAVMEENDFSCPVKRHRDNYAIDLPSREEARWLPYGNRSLRIDDQEFIAEFGLRQIVRITKTDQTERNELPTIMRTWFGTDAGLPGRNHTVHLKQSNDTWTLTPKNVEITHEGPQLWQSYMREQIPAQHGVAFSTAIWNAGFIVKNKTVFLLVTLEKKDISDVKHHYRDHFIDRHHFAWQSQNRTKRSSKHGDIIMNHAESGFSVHLYVRRDKKSFGKPAPFHYCGTVTFHEWNGDQPINVTWKLNNPLPEKLFNYFQKND